MEHQNGRRRFGALRSAFIFLLMIIWTPEGVFGGEMRMERQFERCCGLGTSWASEGLKCEKFTGPVNGVPRVEQGLCLEAVDICCVRAYHVKSCEMGKDDARAGLACVHAEQDKKSSCPGDERRDCCEGCKLGILTGSMGQRCAFKSFAFGKPWDPAFLECCQEASDTDTEVSPTTIFFTDTTSSSNNNSNNETTAETDLTSDVTSSDSTSPDIPTPGLDDICQLMKGLLCSDICVPTPGSFYCTCPEDSILLEDGKTCRKNSPEDRCKINNPCSQNCVDTGSEIKCSCNPGFILGEDEQSCTAVSGRIGESKDVENELPDPRCPAGYEYNKNAQVCDDINECERNPCPGACKNVVGSFVCLSSSTINSEKDYESSQENCPPGYQWNNKVQLCIDIDECLELPGACNEDSHLCVNTQGSFTCHELIGPKACPAGFKFDVAAKICRDVDECAEGIHGCLPEVEACRNTEGAYECDIECRKGFVYNRRRGICLDVDECTESLHPCPDPKTHCVNSVGSYECKKINDSSSSKEKRKSLETSFTDECTSEDGRDMCSMGGDNSVDDDPDDQEIMTMSEEETERGDPDVASSDYDARFVTENGKYVRNEGVLTDDRSVINCPQGAFYNRERKSCECLRGFEIDPVNGECRDSRTNSTTSRIRLPDRDFLKPCRPGFKRDSSSLDCRDIDECTEGPGCQDDENCVNLPGGYECLKSCTEGWRYDPVTSSCIDIDECTENDPCSPETHLCVNKNGTFSCELVKSCENGYRRIYNGSCVDIDECLEGPGCREHELCQNLPGRYDCSPLCVKGWRFDPSTKGCIDVDECQLGLHDCPQTTHRCVNVNGTYDCHLIPPCTIGFRKLFNGSCVDIDECLENLHDCSLTYHRYCVNREGTYECVTRYPECSKGYEYSLRTRNCQDIDECTRGDYKCDSKFAERCVNLPGSWRCERPPSTVHGKKPACPSGYRYDTAGRQCSDVDECTEGLHSCGNEVCYNQPGGYSCSPAPVPIIPRPPKTTDVNTENCKPGTRYMRNRGCIDIDECQEDPEVCTSNEICTNTPGSFVCDCKIGFRRDNLTQACVDINECQLLENDCLPTQRCDNTLGSYNCVRYLPCGTGYTLNAATEICEDDDECVLGTHDCSGGYHCRNTLGSYRCDKNLRSPIGSPRVPTTMTRIFATTPTSSRFDPRPNNEMCESGFENVGNGQCVDVDECAKLPNPCARTLLQKCVNDIGSYRCVSRVICGNGYTLDPSSGSHCVDIDECANDNHDCGPGQTCQNRQGGYTCECPAGHIVGPNKDCVDIDECSLYKRATYGQNYGSPCGQNSRCENNVGSYRCVCEDGFENVEIGRGPGVCQDIDECTKSPGICQHNCINAWGSYRCSCNPGFRLNADNRSCTDIDECVEFKENNLCMGICENTPGSYACSCPSGYKLSTDERTCLDIDECASGRVCRDSNEMCQNTRGSFRCNKIDCPKGYYRDRERKNRCVRTSRYCPSGDLACFRAPSHFSYNFITFVSLLPIPSTGVLELFTMRGTHLPGSTVQFTMALVDARAPPGVTRATESCFALRRPTPSQAVLVLTRSIAGPQEIELDLTMEIYHNSAFAGSAVAKLLIFVSQYEF